jgi:hypothetical protein
VHLHGLHPDGAYGTDQKGRLHFHRAPAPSPAEVATTLERIVKRARGLLSLPDDEADSLDGDELGLAQTYAAAASSTGTGRHGPDEETDGFIELSTRRKARLDGFDLDADVAVHEHDRERPEYLAAYVLRPPIALDRVKLLGPSTVCIELRRPWRDRTTHVSMTASTFLSRLASLVPRPRANTVVYSGVLAGNATGRKKVAPKTAKTKRVLDSSWAALMRHSYGIDVLSCRKCNGRMRFVAVILKRSEVKRILQHLCMWSDPLPLEPARGPPEYPDELDFP